MCEMGDSKPPPPAYPGPVGEGCFLSKVGVSPSAWTTRVLGAQFIETSLEPLLALAAASQLHLPVLLALIRGDLGRHGRSNPRRPLDGTDRGHRSEVGGPHQGRGDLDRDDPAHPDRSSSRTRIPRDHADGRNCRAGNGTRVGRVLRVRTHPPRGVRTPRVPAASVRDRVGTPPARHRTDGAHRRPCRR